MPSDTHKKQDFSPSQGGGGTGVALDGHTPGPWVPDPEVGLQSVLGPDGFMVADCAIFALRKGAPTEARCVANARLVSAAPDLLHASRKLIESLGGEPNSGEGDIHLAYRAAVEAIAKAEGRDHG